MNVELPIKVKDCRALLGVGETYMSAVLRIMGLGRVRRVLLSSVAKYLREHPQFKMTDIYPKKSKFNTRRGGLRRLRAVPPCHHAAAVD